MSEEILKAIRVAAGGYSAFCIVTGFKYQGEPPMNPCNCYEAYKHIEGLVEWALRDGEGTYGSGIIEVNYSRQWSDESPSIVISLRLTEAFIEPTPRRSLSTWGGKRNGAS